MRADSVFDPQDLSEQTRAALRDAFAAVDALTAAALFLCVGEGPRVALPTALARVLADALADVADGRAVEFRTLGDELSTQQAADVLGVSRPFVVSLLDRGELPSWKVGTHRRVRRADVLAHRTRMRAAAEEALQELADQAQELGLGYGSEPAR